MTTSAAAATLRPAPTAREAGPLDADALAHFGRPARLAARGFFDAEEVAAISAWTDELLAMPEARGRHMVHREDSLLGDGRRVVQRVENFCPYHPGFDALVRGGRLRAAVEQLLGGPVCLFKEKITFKMPGGSGFEPHFAPTPVPTEPGGVLFFDSYAPHASKPNPTAAARRILCLTCNRASDGDWRERHFVDKRANFPPDIERRPGVEYKFHV